MRSGVFQCVAVRGAAAQVAAFDLGLRGHRGPNADLDAVALAFAHSAEDGHDEVVGLIVGVDGPADFWNPERYGEVDEEGEGVAELVAVEGALWFSDDDGVEAALWVAEVLKQCGGVWAALPWQGT
ncbi:hypothetical protein ADK54_05280 [Streptomyces sp. WM6378]|nr:hypothetical protein ADK54_05280 [Streptomyces sp. WM6378]